MLSTGQVWQKCCDYTARPLQANTDFHLENSIYEERTIPFIGPPGGTKRCGKIVSVGVLVNISPTPAQNQLNSI